MARRTKEIRITDRTTVLEFRIVEMPATRLEAWLQRASVIIAGAGTSVSLEEIAKGGTTDGATVLDMLIQLIGGLDYDKAKGLLDEMLECCYRKDGKHEERCTIESLDMYVEDVATIFRLRKEALELNLSFLFKGAKVGDFLANLNIGQKQASPEPPATKT